MVFRGAPTVYRRTFLAILGHQLHGLAFRCFSLVIDVVAELLPCNQLKELSICPNCTLPPPESTEFPEDTNFLPQLRKLTSQSCLGVWSPLFFERKRPLLLTLKLACPHIGIASMSKLKWRDVPDLWPGIRELNLYNAKEFTIETLFEIVPELSDLKVLGIPKSSFNSSQEKKLAKDFAAKLQEPVTLRFLNSLTSPH